MLRHEDYAFLESGYLNEYSVSLRLQTFYWSVTTAGFVFHKSRNSNEFYIVELYDLGRKANKYQVTLFYSDQHGYRREVSTAFAEYEPLPDKWVQVAPSPEEWDKATPGWVNIEFKSIGHGIQLYIDGKLVIKNNNLILNSGNFGLYARGPVKFSDVCVVGKEYKIDGCAEHSYKESEYFYPYKTEDKTKYGNFQSFPGVVKNNSILLLCSGVNGVPATPQDLLLVKSYDSGKTWGYPILIKQQDGFTPKISHLHNNNDISIIYVNNLGDRTNSSSNLIEFMRFSGSKKGNSKRLPFIVNDKPLHDYFSDSACIPYSPFIELSDGSLIQYWYEKKVIENGNQHANSDLITRSFVIKSYNDGLNWVGPYYIDIRNTDSNETYGVEVKPGTLVAFSRTLSSRFMWISTSHDYGETWSKSISSNITGEVPCIIKHSSGVLIMASRRTGVYIRTSIDQGKTWSKQTRVSLCSGMMSMVEVEDKRVLLVYHESYRRPSAIRAQYIDISLSGEIQKAV